MENYIDNKFQSSNVNELFAALAKAQGEMEHASKDTDNPFFKSRFADLTSVIDASRPFLSKNGLSVNHFTDISEDGMVNLICQLNHSSGQWMRGYYPIRPVKSDPQGYGSALTYAKRYTYSAIVGVAVIDEDDDGNSAVSSKPENTKKINLLPAYDDKKLRENIPAWQASIIANKHTTDSIINMISTKYTLTDAQKDTIKSLGESNANS